MTATYGWIIDHDYIADEDAPAPSNLNAPGVMGPYDIPEELVELLGKPRGPRNQRGGVPANVLRFRMLDDDGNLYYAGRQAFLDIDDADEEAEFGPLNDFGMPNAGAVHLEQWIDGKWQEL